MEMDEIPLVSSSLDTRAQEGLLLQQILEQRYEEMESISSITLEMMGTLWLEMVEMQLAT